MPRGAHQRRGHVVRRRPLLAAFGLLVVALFVFVELLLVRSYGDTARTTVEFRRTTDATTAVANLQRESLLHAAALTRGDRRSVAEGKLKRALLERQLAVLVGSAAKSPQLTTGIQRIRARVRRLDAEIVRSGRQSAATRRAAAGVDRAIKGVFDNEEHTLYNALDSSLHDRARSQRLTIGLSLVGLFVGILLALLIRHAIRGDFARAYGALAEAQGKLWHQAVHDSLTGLGNRMQFQLTLARALADSEQRLAVLYIDLDGFKSVNDTLGHDAGDDLLCTVASRFRECLREGDLLARLGGDEFAVLMSGVTADQAAATAERLLGRLDEPIRLRNRHVRVGASIGVAVPDAGMADADELIGNADLAMYAAKHSGKGGVCAYDPSMRARARERSELAADLRGALARDELELHYQPIMDLNCDRVALMEALIRWRHPRHGLLSPAVFLPVAEDTGMMGEISRWVVHQACGQARAWPGDIAVSVNVAAEQVEDESVLDDVGDALRATALDPSRLVLEITERTALDAGTHTNSVFARLRKLGVRIALDDFGVGYSSLGALRFMAVEIIKIDRSFVDRVAADPDTRRLTAAIVELGLKLDLQVVAEGIETQDQLEVLRELGCAMGQGFHFARPQPPEQAAALMDGRQAA